MLKLPFDLTYGRLSVWFVMQCDVSSGARFKFAG